MNKIKMTYKYIIDLTKIKLCGKIDNKIDCETDIIYYKKKYFMLIL